MQEINMGPIIIRKTGNKVDFDERNEKTGKEYVWWDDIVEIEVIPELGHKLKGLDNGKDTMSGSWFFADWLGFLMNMLKADEGEMVRMFFTDSSLSISGCFENGQFNIYYFSKILLKRTDPIKLLRDTWRIYLGELQLNAENGRQSIDIENQIVYIPAYLDKRKYPQLKT